MRLPSVVGDRRVLIVFVLVALAASACGLLLRDIDPDQGGAIYNDTGEILVLVMAAALAEIYTHIGVVPRRALRRRRQPQCHR